MAPVLWWLGKAAVETVKDTAVDAAMGEPPTAAGVLINFATNLIPGGNQAKTAKQLAKAGKKLAKHADEAAALGGKTAKKVAEQSQAQASKEATLHRYLSDPKEIEAVRNTATIPAKVDPETGKLKDTYLTDRTYKTGGKAKDHLQMPAKPTHVVDIDPATVPNRTPTTRVDPADNPQWGRGGGTETKAKGDINTIPGSLRPLKGVKEKGKGSQ